MIKKFFSLFLVILCFSCLTHAQEKSFLEKDEPMIVNSGEAQYDGKEIVLIGQVVLQHSLGQISARRLSLITPNMQDKKSKFNFLKINDDIQIELKGGGRLNCQQAEVDYSKMQGVFSGNIEWPDVIFLNTNDGKEDNKQEIRPPLEVKSQQMIFELVREPATSSTSKTLVKQIEAHQNVRVLYNQDYLLLADHALYQRLTTSTPSVLNEGLLTVSGDTDHRGCQMTTLAGDHMQAQSIQINTIERQLCLDHPKGLLYINRETFPTQTLAFTANELTWNDREQILVLKGQVNITQNETVHIHTDREISIVQKQVNGKRTLCSIQAPKQIQLSYLDIEKGNTHKITCPGSFIINHECQEITLEGIINESKQIDENQQVFIEDVLGEMYADRMFMTYQWKNRQLIPEKIILEGHVRLINHFNGHPEESGSLLHYALADRVEYLPEQKEMMLNSSKGNRVLFFDKVNHVQMSATSLKIRHDVITKKDSIQGLGDVRFTFIEKELVQIKKRFSLEESFQNEAINVQSNE